MGHRGENTGIYQRRANLKNSRTKLEGLLAANFQDGAQLVMLTYTAGAVPSRRLADLQLTDWIDRIDRKQGQRLRYIRATAWESGGNSYPVHRVVLGLSGASVGPLAALWEYGPVTVEPVQGDAPDALAALLMAPALEAGRVTVPCGRAWSPSRGLIRPGKEK